MKYLLDTSCWINAVTLPHVLPVRVRRLLQVEEVHYLCSVSLLEAAILFRLGRMRLDATLSQFFGTALTDDVQLVELSPGIAAATNDLPKTFPGDPFDRTIVATAIVLELTLITADSAIRQAGVCSVEYYPFKPSRPGR